MRPGISEECLRMRKACMNMRGTTKEALKDALPCPRRDYSVLSTATGSRRLARQAGSQLATTAPNPRTIATMP